MQFRFIALSASLAAVALSACSDASPLAPYSDARVNDRATAVALSVTRTDTVAIGATLQLTASLPARRSKRNENVVWSSTNDAVARVSQLGLVTAIGGGAATITARNSAGNQEFGVVVPTTPPAPTPIPTPTPTPTPSSAAAVYGLVGWSPSVANISALGGAWERYEADFAKLSEMHWTREGANYNDANYYDRAQIYYTWWARTGNSKYLDRANALALNARVYMESVNYNPQPYLMMLDGVALHAVITGDVRSALTVARTADALGSASSPWAPVIGTTNAYNDARTQARILGALLDAWYLKAQSPAGVDYASRLRDVLNRILASQSADGGYRLLGSCGENPFMTGILNDVLIRYYSAFEPDPRIPAAVQRSVDLLWGKLWLSAAQAFQYYEFPCATGDDGPAPDLNGLIVNGFGFVARTSGDESYFAKGDAVFAGGVANAWLDGSKQFNQQYTTSSRYLGYRFPQ